MPADASPDASGAVDLVSAAHDVLTPEQQLELANLWGEATERFCRKHGKSPTAILYFLVSYLWGWSRTRCKWSAAQLTHYGVHVWSQLG